MDSERDTSPPTGESASVVEIQKKSSHPMSTSAAPSTTTIPSTEPWRRKPNEPLALYQAFLHYLKQGPSRSLRRTYEAHKVTWRQAKRWEWKNRAIAFDESIVGSEVDELERRRQAARDLQADVGREMLEIAREVLARYSARLRDDASFIIKPSDLPKFIETGAKLQRLAMGEPTESIHETKKSLEMFVMAIHEGKNPRRITD